MPVLGRGLLPSNVSTRKRLPAQVTPTTQKDRSMFAPETLFPNAPEYIVVLFDVRIPGVVVRLHRERAAWQEYADIEALDQDHFVLIIRPGGARRLAA
jgi:hypothetical protein